MRFDLLIDEVGALTNFKEICWFSSQKPIKRSFISCFYSLLLERNYLWLELLKLLWLIGIEFLDRRTNKSISSLRSLKLVDSYYCNLGFTMRESRKEYTLRKISYRGRESKFSDSITLLECPLWKRATLLWNYIPYRLAWRVYAEWVETFWWGNALLIYFSYFEYPDELLDSKSFSILNIIFKTYLNFFKDPE